jgi:hypothetical protein
MAKKAPGYSPLKTGTDPRKSGGADGQNNWLKIEPGQTLDVVSLVEVEEIISCEQCAIWLEEGNSPVWVYTGPEDPSHELKIEKRYKAYLPVLVDGETKVWSMGKGAHSQVLDIADAVGELKGLEIRIKRTGNGLSTRYSIVNRGKRHDVSRHAEVDVIAMLGPITPGEVQDMIAQKLGMDSYEDVLERFKGKTIRKGAASAAKSKSRVEVDDEDDEEDLEDAELI